MSPDETRASTASTVLEIFDRATARAPESIALERPRVAAWSYAELDRRADVAARLVGRALGGRPARDAVVAVALSRRDPWLFAALLGTMRAGAAYVAIDPAFPAKQAAAILADAGAVTLIADAARANDILAGFPDLGGSPNLGGSQDFGGSQDLGGLSALPILSRDALDAEVARMSDEDAAPRSRPAADDLAYVIYTSGTTGKPKGVEIEHR